MDDPDLDAPDLDAMIDAGMSLYGIEPRPEWRPAIRMHLAISLGHAQTVLDLNLPDDLDPAPVFKA
jgi:hypothetical protein